MVADKQSETLKPASIGPFLFDYEKNEVTLQPGAYKLNAPLVFVVSPNTKIDGVEFLP